MVLVKENEYENFGLTYPVLGNEYPISNLQYQNNFTELEKIMKIENIKGEG